MNAKAGRGGGGGEGLGPFQTSCYCRAELKLQMHENAFKSLLNRFFIIVFCFRQQPFYSTELNSTSETKSC